MFGRGRKEARVMDPELTFMSKDDADELRERTARAFRDAGVEVEVHPDRLVTSDGHQYGFWNVAAVCAGAEAGREGWDEVIAFFVHSMLNPPPAIGEMSDEELYKLIHSKFYERDAFPEGEDSPLSIGRAFAPGIVELLAVDFPEIVQTVSPSEIKGRNVEELWTRARANTASASIDERDTFDVGNGTVLTLVAGVSPFLSSRAADVDALLRAVFGERAYPYGVLLGLPNRHQVVLHTLDDARSIEALGIAAQYTDFAYRNAAGSLSPFLFWWNGSSVQRVSAYDKKGELEVHAQGEFAEALNALAQVA